RRTCGRILRRSCSHRRPWCCYRLTSGSARLTEHADPGDCARFHADVGDDHAALASAFNARNDGVAGADELVPPRPRQVLEQVGSGPRTVAAARHPRLAGEPSAHADLVARARRIEEPRHDVLRTAADTAESAEESKRADQTLVAQQQL